MGLLVPMHVAVHLLHSCMCLCLLAGDRSESWKAQAVKGMEIYIVQYSYFFEKAASTHPEGLQSRAEESSSALRPAVANRAGEEQRRREQVAAASDRKKRFEEEQQQRAHKIEKERSGKATCAATCICDSE